MPEVWNIFSIPGAAAGSGHHFHHPAAALAVGPPPPPMAMPPPVSSRRLHHSHTSVVAQMHYPAAATAGATAAPARPMHYNWPRQSQDMLMCWTDRSVEPHSHRVITRDDFLVSRLT